MGLLSFLRGKGKDVRKSKTETPTEKEITQEIQDLGLEAEGVEVKVDDATGRVSISGEAKDQETKEKILMAAGNLEGVSEVEDNMAGNAPTTYEVKSGDNLSKIAKATLGDANRYMEIFEANKPMLSDPDKIYPGQVLRIPA